MVLLPATLSVTATVLTFLLRTVTTHTHRNTDTHIPMTPAHTATGAVHLNADRQRRISGCFRTRFTIIIRRRTSTRVSTFARRSATSVERYRFNFVLRPLSTPPWPDVIPRCSFPLSPLSNPSAGPRFSLSLGLQDRCSQTDSARSPPLTSRIKPFNCRIVFDGSFSAVKLLFKVHATGDFALTIFVAFITSGATGSVFIAFESMLIAAL